MAKVTNGEYQQLIERLEEMVKEIKTYRLDTEITKNLADFWYMQKSAELILLREQFTEATKRCRDLREWMDKSYLEIRARYKNDQRWLRMYHDRKKHTKQTKFKTVDLKS